MYKKYTITFLMLFIGLASLSLHAYSEEGSCSFESKGMQGRTKGMAPLVGGVALASQSFQSKMTLEELKAFYSKSIRTIKDQ